MSRAVQQVRVCSWSKYDQRKTETLGRILVHLGTHVCMPVSPPTALRACLQVDLTDNSLNTPEHVQCKKMQNKMQWPDMVLKLAIAAVTVSTKLQPRNTIPVRLPVSRDRGHECLYMLPASMLNVMLWPVEISWLVLSVPMRWCDVHFSRPCSRAWLPHVHIGACIFKTTNSKKQKEQKKKIHTRDFLISISFPLSWARSSPAPPGVWDASVPSSFSSLSFLTPTPSAFPSP
jgi:hypothetical protein